MVRTTSALRPGKVLEGRTLWTERHARNAPRLFANL